MKKLLAAALSLALVLSLCGTGASASEVENGLDAIQDALTQGSTETSGAVSGLDDLRDGSSADTVPTPDDFPSDYDYGSGTISGYSRTNMLRHLPAPEGNATVLNTAADPTQIQVLYLWEEGNVPAKTRFTQNMTGYFDEWDFRPYVTAIPVRAGVQPKGAVVLMAGGAYQFRGNYTDSLPTAAALRELGFNYVFDTDFAADLTIMEEGSEFIERFTHKDQYQWPMFTSCCPGWVRFVKSQYPELTDNLSTAKSPQQMFGAVAKSYFAEKVGIDPKRLFVVSIMPCVSKKSECALPTMKNDAGDPDVDVSITTRELNIMMRANHIEPKYLPEEEFDSPLGSATGAAVVFGTTGGVMDAALRSAYFLVTGKNPDPDAFTAVRGMDGWKEATFNIPGAGDVRVAVVSSLGKARKLIEAVKRGDAAYDFVEVMACPGGCAGGGGQPIHDGTELAEDRGNVLWRLDQGELLRFSHENPDVKALYKDYLGAPLGEKSHHLLHTDHNAWQMPQKML